MSSIGAGRPPAAPRGRPRDPALRLRILEHAARIAAEQGVGVGFDAIARAAGASRTTLYRWWSSPEELFLDALLGSVRESIEPDEQSSVTERLRRQVELASVALVASPTGPPLRALAAAALTSDPAHAAFVHSWLAPRRAVARDLVEQGIAEGSIVDDDPEMLVDVLFAPIYHRVFFTGDAVDEQLVDALMRRVEKRQPA